MNTEIRVGFGARLGRTWNVIRRMDADKAPTNGKAPPKQSVDKIKQYVHFLRTKIENDTTVSGIAVRTLAVNLVLIAQQ